MSEAMQEFGTLPGDCIATVTDGRESESEDSPFYGWSAEVCTNDEGEEVFATLGFPSRDDLVKALREAGITEIYDENGDAL